MTAVNINIGNLIAVLTLMGALAGAWHVLDTRLTVLEVQQADEVKKLAEINLEAARTHDYLLAHNPDFLNLVGKGVDASPVHKFGQHSFDSDTPASAPAEVNPEEKPK